jgi:hypothetical protein
MLRRKKWKEELGKEDFSEKKQVENGMFLIVRIKNANHHTLFGDVICESDIKEFSEITQGMPYL